MRITLLAIACLLVATGVSAWSPIKVAFDFKYVDSPAQDIVVNGNADPAKPRTCTAAGTVVTIGNADSVFQECLSPNGTQNFDANCLITCRDEDVVTPGKTTLAKSILASIGEQFGSLLEVESSGQVTFQSQPTQDNPDVCGGLAIPQATASADVVIFVTARPMHQFVDRVAEGQPCTDGGNGRPILSHLNIAPESLTSGDAIRYILLQAVTQTLGFHSTWFSHFRSPSSPTKTYFEYDASRYPTGPLKAHSGDGIRLDAGKIVVDAVKLGAGNGLKVVTPNVLNTARSYFACSNIDGVELEDSAFAIVSPTGRWNANWEKRILQQEYMTHLVPAEVADEKPVISVFTLSLFQDMGFYKPNMSAAQPIDWGMRQGCDWVAGCSRSEWGAYFCDKMTTGTQIEADMCGYNRKFTGICNTAGFEDDLPIPYQHFPDPKWGGRSSLADNCPYVAAVRSAADNKRSSCMDASWVSSTEGDYYGAWSGSGARCVVSNVFSTRYQNVYQTHIVSDRSRALCNKVACDEQNRPYIRFGREFVHCPTNSMEIEMMFPKGHKEYREPSKKDSVNFTSITSHAYVGIFSCGAGLNEMCTNAGGSHDDLYRGAWPKIDKIWPTQAVQTGGVLVTLTGTNLMQCEDIRVGGLFANVTSRTNEKMTFRSPYAVLSLEQTGQGLGGPGENGVGTVDVQLWCNISNACPEGCAVSTAMRAFNFTKPPQQDFEFGSAFSDFVQSTPGIATGAGLLALLVIAFLFWVKYMILRDRPLPGDKKLDDPEWENPSKGELDQPLL